jgi:PERQ amino acid-rich with GYF domain-containing protein
MARSPSAETPSAPTIAPWAKEVDNQTIKTPSLKEIQEIEAKQAAAREAAEAQARREIFSQQITHQPPPPPAPGLPSTATWATSPSTTPSTGISAWNKPLAKATPVAAGRKTLQQIQKEEEARKAKAAAAAASQAAMSSSNPIISAAGKRYADLASKAATATQNPMTNSAWTTVGPGGKSKGGPLTPTTPSTVPTAPAQTLRTSTSSVGFGAAAAKRPTPPVAPSKPATTSAQEEFLKWCRASMKGLNSGVSRKLLHTLTPIRTKLTSLL